MAKSSKGGKSKSGKIGGTIIAWPLGSGKSK
jgi:hypothetical protein